MRNRISAFLLLLAVSVTTIFGCASTKETTSDSTKSEKTSTEMTPVTLNEVAHSIFYAPMYVAIEKGYFKYVHSHSPEEIASVIAPQFKETDHGTITTILTRYYNQDTWKDNLIFEKKNFDLLQDILESSGELTKRAPYDDLVTTTYAEKAAER